MRLGILRADNCERMATALESTQGTLICQCDVVVSMSCSWKSKYFGIRIGRGVSLNAVDPCSSFWVSFYPNIGRKDFGSNSMARVNEDRQRSDWTR